MQCLSCQKPLSTKSAKLWQRRMLLCRFCCELADKAQAELDAAHKRAALQANMFLEQHILRGGLLTSASALPGLGETAVRDE